MYKYFTKSLNISLSCTSSSFNFCFYTPLYDWGLRSLPQVVPAGGPPERRAACRSNEKPFLLRMATAELQHTLRLPPSSRIRMDLKMLFFSGTELFALPDSSFTSQ